MPTTVNGIGTGYLGKMNRFTEKAHCHQCGLITEHCSYDTIYCIVVIFIPVLPLARKRILNDCQRCRAHQLLPLKVYNNMKQETLDEVTRNVQASPAHPEAIAAFIIAVAEFHAEGHFNDHADQLEKSSSRNAAMLELLGDGHTHFRHLEAAERCYWAALKIQETEQLKRSLAFNLIKQHRSVEALPLLLYVLQDHREDGINVVMQLLYGLQADGRHQEALSLLDRLEMIFPDLPQNKALKKIRKVSTKYRHTNKPKEPANWFLRDPAKKRPIITQAQVVLFFTVIGLYLLASLAMGFHKVHLINGTKIPYAVNVGGKSLDLPADGHQTMFLYEGKQSVSFKNTDGKEIHQNFQLHTDFFTRILDKHTFILNPDQTALIYHEEATYSQIVDPDDPYKLKILPLRPFTDLGRVDYVFKPFPESISTKANGKTTRVRVSQFIPQSNMDAANTLLSLGDLDSLKTYIANCHAFNPSDLVILNVYISLVNYKKGMEKLQPMLKLEPINLEAHRLFLAYSDYQDPLLIDHYRQLAETHPNDADLHYLNGLICLNVHDTQTYFDQALKWSPQHVFTLRALAFNDLTLGKFEHGLAWSEQALAQDADDPESLELHMDLLEEGQQFGTLVDLGLLQLKKNPDDLNLAYKIHSWRIQAAALGQKTNNQSLIPKKHTPEQLENWQIFLKAAESYESGDFDALLDPTVAELYALDMHLRTELDDSCLQDSKDSDYVMALAIEARRQGKSALADKAKASLLQDLAGTTYGSFLAEIISGKEPHRILDARIPPETKRTVLVLVEQEHPDLRKECFALARKLNYRRSFPYHILREVLERS